MSFPGLIQPQVSSYVPGAGNPRDSAMMANQAMNAKQASLNSIGGRRRKRRGGGTVSVPQFQMQYPAANGANNPNDQIKTLSSIGMQTNANSVYDSHATKGGYRAKQKDTKQKDTKQKGNTRKKSRRNKTKRRSKYSRK